MGSGAKSQKLKGQKVNRSLVMGFYSMNNDLLTNDQMTF